MKDFNNHLRKKLYKILFFLLKTVHSKKALLVTLLKLESLNEITK